MLAAAVPALSTCLAAPVQAAVTDVQDSTAAQTRTIPSDGTRVPMFDITFRTTVAGEKRRIRSKIIVAQPSTTSDELLMVGVSITCVPTGASTSSAGTQDKIGQVQNVLRGQRLTLYPRFIFTADAPGSYTCKLGVLGGRPRPNGSLSSNYFTIESGSYLEATTALHPSSSQGYAPDTASTRLDSSEAYDAAVLNWTAPTDVTSFAVSGDVKLTTCTAEGGSTDPVTGVVLCDNRVDFSGTTVRTVVLVMQREWSDPSQYCQVTSFPDSDGQSTFISKDVHHKMIYGGGSATVSTASDCSRDFRIKIYTKHVSGSSVVVHTQGTITAAMPD
jgi:hypothetical protein